MAKKINTYRIDGKKVPSVTTILNTLAKPALVPWASKMATEYVRDNIEPGRRYSQDEIDAILKDAKRAYATTRDEAANFGSTVHDMIEAYIGEQEVNAENEFKTIFENFKKATKDFEWLGSEVIVHNDFHGYGGTADGIALIKDDIALVDVKTSSGVWPEYDIQLAMYATATPEDTTLHGAWGQINKAIILHLDKERLTWQLLERDLLEAEQLIPNLMKLYNWQKNNAR